MKTKYVYILMLGLLSVFSTGCEDRLDIAKHGNMGSQEDFYKTDDDAIQALASLYSSWGGNYYNWFFTKNLLADDVWAGGGSRGDNSQMEQLNEYTFDTDHGMVQGLYSGMYGIIYKSNLIIDLLEPDTEVKKRAVAEARFFRAWSNFELVTLFGTAPVVDHLLTPGEYRLGNSTPEVMWALIESDLTEAINSNALPSKSDVNDSETGIRITKEVAQAMLGKAYIWKGDYQAAKDEFEIIMNGYGYDLTQKYEDNFRDDTEFNAESIWEINYDAKGNSGDSWGNGTSDDSFMGNNLAHYFGPTLKGENIGGGWYKMQPSPYLIKEFISEQRPEGSDSKWDKRLYTTCFFKYSDFGDVKPDEKFYGGKVEFDDMFKWTVLPEGDGKYGIAKQGYAPAYPVIEGVQGRFMMKKFAAWWVPTGCTMYSNDAGRINNLRIMRFAEVLLLHAEACLETNDESGAMKDINRIRVRAGLPEKNLSGKDAIMTELQKQKLLEFAGENIRWDDMVRWYGNDPAKLKAIMHERKTDSQHYELLYEENESGEKELVGYKPTDRISDTQGFDHFEAKFLYFPIPQAEVDANLNLEQKPEWR